MAVYINDNSYTFTFKHNYGPVLDYVTEGQVFMTARQDENPQRNKFTHIDCPCIVDQNKQYRPYYRHQKTIIRAVFGRMPRDLNQPEWILHEYIRWLEKERPVQK